MWDRNRSRSALRKLGQLSSDLAVPTATSARRHAPPRAAIGMRSRDDFRPLIAHAMRRERGPSAGCAAPGLFAEARRRALAHLRAKAGPPRFPTSWRQTGLLAPICSELLDVRLVANGPTALRSIFRAFQSMSWTSALPAAAQLGVGRSTRSTSAQPWLFSGSKSSARRLRSSAPARRGLLLDALDPLECARRWPSGIAGECERRRSAG